MQEEAARLPTRRIPIPNPSRPRATRTPFEAAFEIVREFAIDGHLDGIEPHERGHIHNTFISTWKRNDQVVRFLHQQLNHAVFRDIPGLMHNIVCITRHLHAAGVSRTLKLVPTRRGDSFLMHASGPWRTYRYIENTESFDLCESEERASEAARAFGEFQARLTDLDVGQLRETIPNFFSSPYRLGQLDAAVAADVRGRVDDAAAELEFVGARREMVDVIEQRMRAGEIPVRVVHGDTKLNNVLFDRSTGQAVSIVDLDTCMPGYSLYDFGDLVRFTAAKSSEDEPDLTKVGTDLGLYRALVRGYLETARGFLTDAEVALMPFAARLVTFTIGLRFLTDYLEGDVYFKVARREHNLERARVQFGMVACMERHEDEMAVR